MGTHHCEVRPHRTLAVQLLIHHLRGRRLRHGPISKECSIIEPRQQILFAQQTSMRLVFPKVRLIAAVIANAPARLHSC